MIEKIATDVSNMLNSSTRSRDFDGLVGMRAHMEMMELLLRLDLDAVRMIGIWGPPGIGKSTIARVLFNKLSSRFQLGAIMVNIKARYPTPCLDEYNAQLQLQNQMLSQVINHKGPMISHLGVAQERLKDKKVFLVLDDVDRLGQLNALAEKIQWFGSGSLIIITTENQRVLKAHGIKHIYKVNFPSSDEAFQIFCMHAFGKKHPDDGFFKLAMKVTNLAGELPLGLKILGSALRGMSKQEWRMTIPSLQTRLDGEIKTIIEFSYNALHDEDKELFLYIACFFNFKPPRHRLEEILAKKFSNVSHGLDVLAEKSLIDISIYEERIEMHALLENFGKETNRKNGQLWVDERDKCELLSEDTTDGKRFIGIKLNKSFSEDFKSEKALKKMSDLQFLRIYEDYNERLSPLFYHSQKIRSLYWMDFQDICLPSNFNPEFLVELVMHTSRLQKLWEGTKSLRNLKWMDLSYSTDLKELPDLSTTTNLEELILFCCSSLVELPSSIENATNLQKLNLSFCSMLVNLPSSIGNATNLKELDLSKCSNLQEVAPWVKGMSRLRKLRLNDCSNLVSLPQFSDSLRFIEADNCKSLERLDCSFNNPDIFLKFTNCFKLNQEARDIIMHTSTREYAILPGTQVPACFDNRATAGGPLKIKLNESSLPTSIKFKACIVLVIDKVKTGDDEPLPFVVSKTMVGQNDLPVVCKPSYHCIFSVLTEHIYTFEFEASEVTSTELVFEFKTGTRKWKIGECGLYQILEAPSC